MRMELQTCSLNDKHKFHARIRHKYCRKCHRSVNGEPRFIKSREVSTNKYRRTRSRRKHVVAPKVVAKKR